MQRKIRKCVVCGVYTLKLEHCNKKTQKAGPPIFKLNPKYYLW